jgi:ABC-type dipeptide/oligopeptide/nickel transport system permease component
VRRRVLRNALSPLLTHLGVLVPSLLTGAVVVEQVFALPGLGRLGLQAVLDRDVSTVMAVTLFSAVVIMLSLLASDLLHRRFDPRVVLR